LYSDGTAGLSFYCSYDRQIESSEIVGTAGYKASEIVLSQPHSFSADY
jgi:hypothetical protein